MSHITLLDQQIAVLELAEQATRSERKVVDSWAIEYGVEVMLLPWAAGVAKAITETKPVVDLKELIADERRFSKGRFEDINPKANRRHVQQQRMSVRQAKEVYLG